MGVVAALGSTAILWAWWDSTQYYLLWVTRDLGIGWHTSKIVIRLGNAPEYFYLGSGFHRAIWIRGTDLFPGIEMSPGTVVLPMWFILCAYLSALLLLWLFLMKRLARPQITEG